MKSYNLRNIYLLNLIKAYGADKYDEGFDDAEDGGGYRNTSKIDAEEKLKEIIKTLESYNI